MNYDVLFGADTIITTLFIVIAVGWWFSLKIDKESNRWKLFATVAAIAGLWLSVAATYKVVLKNDTVSYGYKYSIEQGLNDGYSRNFYKASSDEQKNILDGIKKADLNKGKIGYAYGYAYSDSSTRDIELYFTSMGALKGLPVLLILALLAVMYAACIVTLKIIKTAAYRTEYREKIDSEIEQRDRELQRIIDMKREAAEAVNDLRFKESSLQSSVERLKAAYEEGIQRDEEMLGKTAEYNKLMRQLAELNGQIQEKKEAVRQANAQLTAKQQQAQILDKGLEEKRQQLDIITNSIKAASSLSGNQDGNDDIDLNNIFSEKTV